MDARYETTIEPFGSWLLRQEKRDDWIGALAKGLKGVGGFPRQGTPEDVRKFLAGLRASGDDFEAVDDAEMDWLAL